MERAKAMAPPQHTAAAASSTLCKLLAWDADGLWQQVQFSFLYFVCVLIQCPAPQTWCASTAFCTMTCILDITTTVGWHACSLSSWASGYRYWRCCT